MTKEGEKKLFEIEPLKVIDREKIQEIVEDVFLIKKWRTFRWEEKFTEDVQHREEFKTLKEEISRFLDEIRERLLNVSELIRKPERKLWEENSGLALRSFNRIDSEKFKNEVRNILQEKDVPSERMENLLLLFRELFRLVLNSEKIEIGNTIPSTGTWSYSLFKKKADSFLGEPTLFSGKKRSDNLLLFLNYFRTSFRGSDQDFLQLLERFNQKTEYTPEEQNIYLAYFFIFQENEWTKEDICRQKTLEGVRLIETASIPFHKKENPIGESIYKYLLPKIGDFCETNIIQFFEKEKLFGQKINGKILTKEIIRNSFELQIGQAETTQKASEEKKERNKIKAIKNYADHLDTIVQNPRLWSIVEIKNFHGGQAHLYPLFIHCPSHQEVLEESKKLLQSCSCWKSSFSFLFSEAKMALNVAAKKRTTTQSRKSFSIDKTGKSLSQFPLLDSLVESTQKLEQQEILSQWLLGVISKKRKLTIPEQGILDKGLSFLGISCGVSLEKTYSKTSLEARAKEFLRPRMWRSDMEKIFPFQSPKFIDAQEIRNNLLSAAENFDLSFQEHESFIKWFRRFYLQDFNKKKNRQLDIVTTLNQLEAKLLEDLEKNKKSFAVGRSEKYSQIVKEGCARIKLKLNESMVSGFLQYCAKNNVFERDSWTLYPLTKSKLKGTSSFQKLYKHETLTPKEMFGIWAEEAFFSKRIHEEAPKHGFTLDQVAEMMEKCEFQESTDIEILKRLKALFDRVRSNGKVVETKELVSVFGLGTKNVSVTQEEIDQTDSKTKNEAMVRKWLKEKGKEEYLEEITFQNSYYTGMKNRINSSRKQAVEKIVQELSDMTDAQEMTFASFARKYFYFTKEYQDKGAKFGDGIRSGVQNLLNDHGMGDVLEGKKFYDPLLTKERRLRKSFLLLKKNTRVSLDDLEPELGDGIQLFLKQHSLEHGVEGIDPDVFNFLESLSHRNKLMLQGRVLLIQRKTAVREFEKEIERMSSIQRVKLLDIQDEKLSKKYLTLKKALQEKYSEKVINMWRKEQEFEKDISLCLHAILVPNGGGETLRTIALKSLEKHLWNRLSEQRKVIDYTRPFWRSVFRESFGYIWEQLIDQNLVIPDALFTEFDKSVRETLRARPEYNKRDAYLGDLNAELRLAKSQKIAYEEEGFLEEGDDALGEELYVEDIDPIENNETLMGNYQTGVLVKMIDKVGHKLGGSEQQKIQEWMTEERTVQKSTVQKWGKMLAVLLKEEGITDISDMLEGDENAPESDIFVF